MKSDENMYQMYRSLMKSDKNMSLQETKRFALFQPFKYISYNKSIYLLLLIYSFVNKIMYSGTQEIFDNIQPFFHHELMYI